LIRLKGPDEDDVPSKGPAPAETAPARLRLPSPAELGLPPAGADKVSADASVNWTEVHNRLDRLGALSFHQEKMPGGGCRITFLLPTGQPHRAHQIDAQAETAAEAVRLALERAEMRKGRE
jgi:hypothetical protein